jgi:hypothetical protein
MVKNVADASSPDALGVVRNLPGAFATGACHPVVAGTQAGLDRQQDLEHGGRDLVAILALRQMPGGRRIVRIESPFGDSAFSYGNQACGLVHPAQHLSWLWSPPCLAVGGVMYGASSSQP